MKKIVIGLLIFVFAIGVFQSPITHVQANNTYYVSTIGNDSNTGAIDQPWLTIQKATNTVVA